ncbi:GDSL esterase/lipase At1g29660-like [Populus nigra]|uniref:GDSL esterase/lipase At1g29660-like n=1 Tax=Populus nigra TaxID=3691 RepID=UPI002B2676CC|nr:GDSL esterase/lipase At1g29660-like [Populus nigra]
MAYKTKLHLSIFLLLIVTFCEQDHVHGEPKVPCYFIFGDSLVDSGNNNNLETIAKVNYPPYGIDFPGGPTGRFTNGRTIADIMGELLGFDDFIPSFLTVNSSEILKGVNYASGSAGIRQETGKQLGVNLELSRQLENHQSIVSRIVDMLGNESVANHLNKCFYWSVIGSNDYLNNYFMPQYYNTSSQYTPDKYAEALIKQYSQQIMKLYNSGARKVALNGIGPIGCAPHSTANYDTKGSLCVDYMNDAVNYFNSLLISLVNQLNNDLADARFIYLNAIGFGSENIASPAVRTRDGKNLFLDLILSEVFATADT